MNEKAVKQLTEKGCIVEKEVAEALKEEDIEKIESLDSAPMYITEEMLSNLREEGDIQEPGEEELEELRQKETVKTDVAVDGSETVEDSPEESTGGEQGGSENTGSTASMMRDTGDRSLRTKVEVVDGEEISREEKDVPEFLEYYNDRYDRMKKILLNRMEMKSAVTINRLERRSEGEEGATIGLVKNKYSTSSGKYIVELEDKTGTYKTLVDERDGDRIVPDEVIGVRGSMGDDIIFANTVIRPDLPIPDGVNTTQERVKAAYISDLHIGSKDTMHRKLDRFAEWLNTDRASRIGYLVIPGDVVEGVGVYPDQDDELEVENIYSQYSRFEDWVEKLPDDLQVIVGPGNHDLVRLAEPQPRLPEDVFPRISDFNNVHLVQNPQYVRLHGIRSQGIMNLMYHGYSFDGHADQIQDLREKAYEEPHHVMIDLLKRRHLAPTYGTNLLAPEERDRLVIEKEPDIMVSGHFHSHANESYKGVNVICASSFQSQTSFQKRMGHEPQPGLVTVVDYKTRNTEVKKF